MLRGRSGERFIGGVAVLCAVLLIWFIASVDWPRRWITWFDDHEPLRDVIISLLMLGAGLFAFGARMAKERREADELHHKRVARAREAIAPLATDAEIFRAAAAALAVENGEGTVSAGHARDIHANLARWSRKAAFWVPTLASIGDLEADQLVITISRAVESVEQYGMAIHNFADRPTDVWQREIGEASDAVGKAMFGLEAALVAFASEPPVEQGLLSRLWKQLPTAHRVVTRLRAKLQPARSAVEGEGTE